jgi:hypothetical protein
MAKSAGKFDYPANPTTDGSVLETVKKMRQ